MNSLEFLKVVMSLYRQEWKNDIGEIEKFLAEQPAGAFIPWVTIFSSDSYYGTVDEAYILKPYPWLAGEGCKTCRDVATHYRKMW